MLEADAGVHLCLWMQHCRPDLVPLVELLQANYRARHVSVYHKRGADTQNEFGGIGHETEVWPWQHTDLRYFSPAGLVGKGSARLWETLQFDWRTIPLIHSRRYPPRLHRRPRPGRAAPERTSGRRASSFEIRRCSGLCFRDEAFAVAFTVARAG